MKTNSVKNIAILGSTGSIGKQALEIIEQHSDIFRPVVLTAGTNADLLISQAKKFKPQYVVIADETQYQTVSEELSPFGINVLSGTDAISEIVTLPEIDMVLTAMVGFAGLKPTVNAIKHGKNIALANKETLVVAGNIIMSLAKEYNVSIIPVDSEHSAIFQCIEGERHNNIEKIILTASGGPFRGMTFDELKTKTKAEALKHPNWNMGAKITIDSASLMNKGLEVIEARWLFDIPPEKIEVIIHPQSIIHSLVQFEDGSIKAQLGLPDMKLPILYAFSYPQRIKSQLPRFDFLNYPELTFEKPDTKVFRNLQLAFDALQKGGNMPCILNAANEIAVDAFLHDKIKFTEMPEIIEQTMQKVNFVLNPTLEDLYQTDKEARKVAQEIIKGK